MCLAMMVSPGAVLNEEHLAEAWLHNSDGGGFAHLGADGRIVVRKYLKFDDFAEGLLKRHASYGEQSPFIVHFRLATHGTTDITNVHPFRVTQNLVAIHNGIIRVPKKRLGDRSDTRTVCEDYLSKLPRWWLDDWALVDLVEDFVGYGSKMVFLSNDIELEASTYILNEDAGHWKEGIWYSNYTYQAPRTKVKTTYYGGGSTTSRSSDGTTRVWNSDTREWTDVEDERAIEEESATSLVLSEDTCYFCAEMMPFMERPFCFGCEMCNFCWRPFEECMCPTTLVPEALRARAANTVAMKQVIETARERGQTVTGGA